VSLPDERDSARQAGISSNPLPQETASLHPGGAGTGPSPSGQAEQLQSQFIRAGEVLAGRYRIVRQLGNGGMGEVFEAEDLELRTAIALKTIRSDIAGGSDALERFKREVHLARQVTHPNVCRIFDLGCHVADSGGTSGIKTWFLTMELLSGPTLSEAIARGGPMTAKDALLIVKQLAAGLNAAHGVGIVHRDFKSANVILVSQEAGGARAPQAKITDFGLARAFAGSESAMTTLTGSGALAGTPAYMAPEQVEGSETTARTDIYALGIVMYEMRTGTLPFTGPTPWAVAVKRLKESPASPRVHVPDIEVRWETAILRCLEKNPADRFGSAVDVISALESAESAPKATEEYERAARLSGTAKSPGKRKTTWIALAAIAAALLLISALYLFPNLIPDFLRNRTSRKNVALSPVTSRAAPYGWRQTVFPADLSLSNVSVVAAAPGSTELALFGASSLQTWEPGQHLQPAAQTGFTVAGRASCGEGVWLIHDDYLHITNWDIEKQRALKTITLPRTFHAAACLDATGERWALLVRDGEASRLIEFDARANQILRSMLLPGLYIKATVDSRSHYVALVGRDSISLRTCEHLEEVLHDALPETLTQDVAYGWSPSGRYFGFGLKQLVVYDLEQKKRISSLVTTGWIADVGWISDNGLSVMDDRGRLYWTSDLLKGWELQQEPVSESVYRAFWVPASLRWVAINESGRALSWEYATPSLLFDLPVSPLELWSIAPDPRGSRVAVSSKDQRIYIVDLLEKKVVRTLEGHTDGVPMVRYDSSHRLISVGDDSTIRVWDPDTGTLLQTVQGHHSLINAFAISPDGHWMISVSSDLAIKLWELPGMTLTKELGRTKDAGAAIAFLPGDNEHFLVSDWGGAMYLYEGSAPNWQLRQQFQLGRKEIIYMVCPGNHAWWAAVPFGEKAGLWTVPADDIRRATQIPEASGYYCWTTNDGQLTATVAPTSIELRSNSNGKINAEYYIANQAGVPVAIQTQPPTVLVGLGNGHLLAWPLISPLTSK
jgi:serine/threonine protein kinase